MAAESAMPLKPVEADAPRLKGAGVGGRGEAAGALFHEPGLVRPSGRSGIARGPAAGAAAGDIRGSLYTFSVLAVTDWVAACSAPTANSLVDGGKVFPAPLIDRT